ncbi:arylacetamide deacetylase-like 4 [Erythrolamprus reginae]|uniref:arylacetamide deacetylase-like 4 n=1 Tax=Erythrolamprus reginae TaxID=121349 RepID=UPI00396CEB6B
MKRFCAFRSNIHCGFNVKEGRLIAHLPPSQNWPGTASSLIPTFCCYFHTDSQDLLHPPKTGVSNLAQAVFLEPAAPSGGMAEEQSTSSADLANVSPCQREDSGGFCCEGCSSQLTQRTMTREVHSYEKGAGINNLDEDQPGLCLPMEAEVTVSQVLWTLARHFSIWVTLLLLAWTLYYDFTRTQIPPGISQGAKLRLMNLTMSLVLRLALVLEKLGLCHKYVLWRLIMDGFPPGRAPDLTIQEVLFDAVPVRIYWPRRAGAGPKRGLVWVHGGLGLFGSSRAYERFCRFIAQTSNTVVVCIRYPLAPEHPYPAQQRSCYAAVSHFLKNAGAYGVDPQRVVLAGDSSGASIVAAISQQLVTRADLPPARGHLLLYPFLQALDFNLPSYQQNHSVPILFKKRVIRLGMLYLTGRNINVDGIMGNAHVPQELRAKYRKWISAELLPEEFRASVGEPFAPSPFSEELYQECKRALEPMFSPLLAEDAVVQKFPETFLLTCEYDVFRDDGLLYKKRLEENSVPVTWHHVKDGFHGICLLTGLGPLEFPSTSKSLGSVIQFLEHF